MPMETERQGGIGAFGLALFASGAAIGAGLALLFGPGPEGRRRARAWWHGESELLRERAQRLQAAYKAGREAYAHADKEVGAGSN